MRSLKKRGPHVLDDLNDLLFSLQHFETGIRYRILVYLTLEIRFRICSV